MALDLATFHLWIVNFETFLTKGFKDKVEMNNKGISHSNALSSLMNCNQSVSKLRGKQNLFSVSQGFQSINLLINHNLSLTFASYLLCWFVIF